VNGRNGDLLLSFDRPPQKDVSIQARYASVTIELPSSSAFRVDARTEFGDVNTDFEGLTINRDRRERIMTGEVRQGGPQLTITTRNANISLRERG
jgi:hypothetical protein